MSPRLRRHANAGPWPFSVGHRLIVWQFKADPGAQCGGKHAQALGRLLHEIENTSLKRICAGSNGPYLGLVSRIPLHISPIERFASRRFRPGPRPGIWGIIGSLRADQHMCLRVLRRLTRLPDRAGGGGSSWSAQCGALVLPGNPAHVGGPSALPELRGSRLA